MAQEKKQFGSTELLLLLLDLPWEGCLAEIERNPKIWSHESGGISSLLRQMKEISGIDSLMNATPARLETREQ